MGWGVVDPGSPPTFQWGDRLYRYRQHPPQALRRRSFSSPQTPEPHRCMRLNRISVFPGSLKQKGPMGPRVAYTCGVSGGLGRKLKDLHEPGIRALKVLPPNAAGPFPGRRHTSPGFHASSNTPRAWRNILTYNLTSPLLGRRLN